MLGRHALWHAHPPRLGDELVHLLRVDRVEPHDDPVVPKVRLARHLELVRLALDGERTLRDGVQLLRAAADLPSLCTLDRCDVDGNGTIALRDAVQVLRAAAALPIQGNCGG